MTEEETVESIKADLAAPAKPPKRKEVKKVAKKVKKAKDEETTEGKAVKKKAKSSAKSNGNGKEDSDEGMVTVADLAGEAEISPQSARVKLRSAEIDRGEGRWKWAEGSKSLKAARKALGLEG